MHYSTQPSNFEKCKIEKQCKNKKPGIFSEENKGLIKQLIFLSQKHYKPHYNEDYAILHKLYSLASKLEDNNAVSMNPNVLSKFREIVKILKDL